MELICRTFYHIVLSFIFKSSGLKNYNAFNNNIKRIGSIIKNDYRNYIGEELQAESEGSCSMVSESFSADKGTERSNEFEYPERLQGDEPESHSAEKSNGSSD